MGVCPRLAPGHAAISPALAVRLERAGAGTARHWLAMQTAYDLWQAEHSEQPEVRQLAS